MKLFKHKIPTGDTKEVTILESWTVTWSTYVRDFSTYGKKVTYSKIFIHENEADEFVKSLNDSAKFIGADIFVNKSKN